MAIIAYGRLDKKLLLIVLNFVVQTAYLFAMYEGANLYQSHLVQLIDDIAPTIGGIILYFIFKNKEIYRNKQKKRKKCFLYVIVLFFLRAVHLAVDYFYPYFVKEQKYRINNITNSLNGIAIILMTLFTFLLLKYKYYIHHIITMIIFCVLGISIDAILGSYKIVNLKYFYIYIIYVIDDVMIYCYMKYMMDKLYYQYTEVIISYGISGLISKLAVMIGLGIYENKNNINGSYGNIINSLNKYFKNTNVAAIIFFQFIFFLIDFFFKGLLMILIIFYLRPNHMIVNDQVNLFESIIIYKNIENKEKNIKQTDKYYTFIPFVFQILSMLFYFEILELNFCKLNKNTVKNIQAREKLQFGNEDEGRDSVRNDSIELVGQYYLVDDESTLKEEEAKEKSDAIKINDDKEIN